MCVLRRRNVYAKRNTFLYSSEPTNEIEVEHSNEIQRVTPSTKLEKERESKRWIKAMNEKMNSLKVNDTWELIPTPKSCKPICYKWVYKIKEGVLGVLKTRYKTRLVAKDYTQREGIDYTKVFFLIVKHISMRVLLSLAV